MYAIIYTFIYKDLDSYFLVLVRTEGKTLKSKKKKIRKSKAMRVIGIDILKEFKSYTLVWPEKQQ